MRIPLILIGLFLANFCFGQFTYQGKIIDVNTNLAIEGVSITIKANNRGTVSDQAGTFRLQIKETPAQIRISHVAYETQEINLTGMERDEVMIFLIPKINYLDEVTVRAEEEAASISNTDKYSVRDFELIEGKVYRLEYHGSFKKHTLSLTDVYGTKKDALKLENIKQVERLYKSCEDVLYLLTSNKVYPVENNANKLSLGPPIKLSLFNRFIRPCHLRMGAAYFFITQKYNGLVSIISKYDFTRDEKIEVRVIGDEKQIEHYQSDLGKIIANQDISNVSHVSDKCDNDRIRGLQADIDFLQKVFYRPEFPVYICENAQKLVILNHHEQKVETYQNLDLESEVAIDYVLDKKWMKKIIIDQKNEKVYGVFDLKKGLGIKEINTTTGETQLLCILETATQNFETIKIQDHQVFYLKEKGTNSGLMELLRQNI